MFSKMRKIECLRLAIVLTGCLWSCAGFVYAQAGFQNKFGSACEETGFFGATVVQQCSGGGYTYVGTTDFLNDQVCDPSNQDVYVIRTNDAGTTTGTIAWEQTIDIGNLGGNDIASGMIEVSDGSGFVIVGTSTLGHPTGNTDIFLIKLACDGSHLWTVTYGLIDASETGYDIFEARTGDGVITNAGDFIIAGSITLPSGNIDSYIMRVDANGSIVWENRYTTSPHDASIEERFYSLTDLDPVQIFGQPQPQATGDIIAVGELSEVGMPGLPKNGFVVRVDGADGTINFGPQLLQGAISFGGGVFIGNQWNFGDEGFLSVIELRKPIGSLLNPDVVISGFSRSGTQPESYLVRLQNGNPKPFAALEMLIGDGHLGTQIEEATSIRQVRHIPVAGASYAQDDLIFTGFVNTNTGTSAPRFDATLVALDPTLLTPTGTLGMHYGKNSHTEIGWSLDIVPNNAGRPEGVFIGGTVISTVGMSSHDLYLTKTNPNGSTSFGNCMKSYNPTASDPLWTPLEETVTIARMFPIITQYTDEGTIRNWGSMHCLGLSKPASGEAPLGLWSKSRVDVAGPGILMYPNPIAAGETLALDYMPISAGGAKATISNALGVVVYSGGIEAQAPTGGLRIATSGWAAGSYFVEIRDGEHSMNASFVITR